MDIDWLSHHSHPKTDVGKQQPASLVLRPGDLLTAAVLAVEKGNDALLSIGQFKAYARLPLPVVTGQEMHIRVEAVGENLRMVMLPRSGRPATASTGDRLVIRLFEPLSEKPSLPTHSGLPVPGESLHGRITGFEKDGLMLVDFGKFKAFANIDIPVLPGQTLPLAVVKKDDGIAFVVAPTTARTGSSNRPPVVSAPYVLTDKVVAEALPPRALTVHGAPPERVADPADKLLGVTAGPSPPPTAVVLEALREQVQRILDETDPAGRPVSTLLTAPVKASLINLQQALSPALPTGDATGLADLIRHFVENSGLYFEKRLERAIQLTQARSAPLSSSDVAGQPLVRNLMATDMKPNLLILKHFLDKQPLDATGTDRHLLETLKGLVHRAVAHIDQQLSMATEKPADPDLFQAFSHLILLADRHHHARLKVYYTKKGREEKNRTPRVSLLLEMDRLGSVRTDLWMVGKDLNVTFFVKDEDVKAAVDAGSHRIASVLEDTFNTVALNVVVNQKKIAAFDGEDLTLPQGRQVDLNI